MLIQPDSLIKIITFQTSYILSTATQFSYHKTSAKYSFIQSLNINDLAVDEYNCMHTFIARKDCNRRVITVNTGTDPEFEQVVL